MKSMIRNPAHLGLNLKTTAMIALAAWLAACGGQGADDAQPGSQTAPDIVRPAQIESVSVATQAGLTFNGLIQSARRSELAFKTSGRVAELRADEGDRVNAQQVLAVLDDAEFRLALESAKARFDKADADFRRAEQIYRTTQAISRSELDKLRTERNLARNQLDMATRDLAETQLKAPFQGMIARRLVSAHSRVQANQAIYTLHDLNDLEVVIDVPSSVVIGGSRQDEAWALIEALPDERFPLQLKFFSSEADPVSQTYSVVLGFKEMKGHNLFPGMPVKVIPAAGSGDSASIVVPLGAIVPSNTGVQNVWLVGADDRVELRPVQTGALVGDRVTIVSGLAVGDRIVTAGLKELRPGMRVRPLGGAGAN